MRSTIFRAAVAVLGGALLLVGVGVAQAAPHFQNPPSVQIGYTDAATPDTAYDVTEQQNVPLGARRDDRGRRHVSRVYATFDVAAFAGKSVFAGTIRIQEASAADCTKRAIAVWEVAPISKTPTWNSAPAPRRKLDEIRTPEFCPATITFDVSAAVTDAVARGKQKVSFEIRVPRDRELDVAYGRELNWFTSVGFTVKYNSAPTILPQFRYNGGFACDDTAPFRPLGSFGDTLQALAADADEDDDFNLTYEFAVWQQDNPDDRLVLTDENGSVNFAGTVRIPDVSLVDGRTYTWQVRVGDGAETSAWSAPCSFVLDRTEPTPPTVTSSDYPPEGATIAAEPGEFTFDAGGNVDTAGFEYTWNEFSVPGCTIGEHAILQCEEPFPARNAVRADVPGGTATVTLTPPSPGTNVLRVRAIDEAGNRSDDVRYEFIAG